MSKMATPRSVTAGQRFPELRRWPRYPVSARAEAVVLPGGHNIVGGVSVISRSGCYYRTTDTLAVGTILQLRIERNAEIFESWARVVHAVAGDGMGLAFFDTDHQQIDLLERWLRELASTVSLTEN
jgi:hypothetical protein